MKHCLATKMNDVIVRVLKLPRCVEGVTVPSPDGIYNIYINSIFSEKKRYEILKHELSHIKNFDFGNFQDIEIIELRASECIKDNPSNLDLRSSLKDFNKNSNIYIRE